jgi:gliding motility-associated-like protein
MVRPLVTYLTDSFCIGQTYNYRGETLSAAGIYQDTITTISGCDSLIVFTLTYKKPIETLIRKKICEGDSYNFEGSIISSPGNYSHTYNATNGCDSLVTLVLETIPTQQTYIKAQINKGETYVFGSKSITDSGIYADSLKSSLNCDSIIILNLTVVEDTTIFIPEGFSPNGDGVNDLFEIKNIDKYPNNHIWIFNRWGNLLFDGKPYLNNWDGKSKYAKMNGDDLPPTGTYFYILDLGDGSKPRKGYVWMQR